MSKPKIAIVGASGFVGSALCERLFFEGNFEPVPILHTAARSARLARLPIRLELSDVLDHDQLTKAMTGCDFVVNCSRGGPATMIKGLKHLIQAARRSGATGFIHLGSASIYGDLMHGGVIDDAATPRPENSYASVKLAQDKIVLDNHRSGLKCVVICPPTIYGPYSSFITSLSSAILSGRVPLVAGPPRPTNLIHVDNLVEGILTVTQGSGGWGERYLINETGKMSWADFFQKISTILHSALEFIPVPHDYLQLQRAVAPEGGALNSLKTLVSGEFRRGLAQFSFFNRLNNGMYDWFTGTSPTFQKRVRRYLERPISIAKQTQDIKLDTGLIIVQRDIYYSPDRFIQTFGYRPLLTSDQQFQTLASWFDFTENLRTETESEVQNSSAFPARS